MSFEANLKQDGGSNGAKTRGISRDERVSKVDRSQGKKFRENYLKQLSQIRWVEIGTLKDVSYSWPDQQL